MLVEKVVQQTGGLKVRRLLVVIQIGLAIPQLLFGSEPTPQQGATTQHFEPIRVYIDCPQRARHQLTDSLLYYEDMFEVRTTQDTAEYSVHCSHLRELGGVILFWNGEVYSQGKVVETFSAQTGHGVVRVVGLAMLRHRLLDKGERNQPEIPRQTFEPVKVSVRVAIPRENESGVSLKELLRNVGLQKSMVRYLSDARGTRGLFEVQDQEIDADYTVKVTWLAFNETSISIFGELHHKNKLVTKLFGVELATKDVLSAAPERMYKALLHLAAEGLLRRAKMAMLRHRLLGQ